MAHLTNDEAAHFMDELAENFPHDRAILEREPLRRSTHYGAAEMVVKPGTRVFVVRLIKSSFWAQDIAKLQEIIDAAGEMDTWSDRSGFGWRLSELVSSEARAHWHLPAPAFTITKR